MCDLRVVADTARFAHVEYVWTEVVRDPDPVEGEHHGRRHR
jgi:hypothetical protein